MTDLSMTYNILHDKISVNNEFFTLNPFVPTAPYKGALKLAEIAEKNSGTNGLIKIVTCAATLSKSLYHLLKLIHINFSFPIVSYLCEILSPLQSFSLEAHFHLNII